MYFRIYLLCILGTKAEGKWSELRTHFHFLRWCCLAPFATTISFSQKRPCNFLKRIVNCIIMQKTSGCCVSSKQKPHFKEFNNSSCLKQKLSQELTTNPFLKCFLFFLKHRFLLNQREFWWWIMIPILFIIQINNNVVTMITCFSAFFGITSHNTSENHQDILTFVNIYD